MADGIAIGGRCINHHKCFLILGRCYCLFLADVIAMVMTDVVMVLWQMLLLYLCLFYGRCYCHVVFGRCYCQFFVEDVKPHHCFPTFCNKCEWLMLLLSGRWNGHCRVMRRFARNWNKVKWKSLWEKSRPS